MLGREFDAGRRRVPAWIAERLNARMLAIWFMDRGSIRPHASRRPLAELGVEGYAERDVGVLLAGLSRLGLRAEAQRGRVAFDLAGSRALLERIAPYVPGPSRWRLGPAVAVSVPFDASLLAPGRGQTVFGEVEVEEVAQRPGPDTPFFCIDVAGAHSFDTAAGVVHTCRPPGNRDPRPEEIEACESHLFRQIELIRPRVVVTLGNFATKLLSGRPDGITRVHGVEQAVVLGGRHVLLYPIYHPAAALYTPRMLEVLEADFQRLPALLRARGGTAARACRCRAGGGEPRADPERSSAAGRRAASSQTPAARRRVPAGAAYRGGMATFTTAAPGETEALGARLGVVLAAGDVVSVSGELGAGKTTFIRGACRALGVASPVTSPTFAIGHRYQAPVPVSHLDLYRLEAGVADDWADLESYFDGTITFVEWPEHAGAWLPPPRAVVVMAHRDEFQREVRIDGVDDLRDDLRRPRARAARSCARGS